MNRKLNIVSLLILCAVAVMLVVIMVIGTVSNSFSFWHFNERDEAEVESYNYTASQIENFSVNSKSLETEIYTTDSDEIKVVLVSGFDENSRSKLEISQNGSTLDIEVRTKVRFGFNFGNEYVKVYLPKSYDKNVSFEAASGGLESENTIYAGKAVFNTSSGSISIKEIECTGYGINSNSGSIRIDSLSGDGEVNSSSGSINIDKVEGKSHKIESNSGSIRIQDMTGNASCRSSSGSINIDSYTGECNIKTNSGTIRVESMTGFGSFDTSSGGITISSIDLTGNLTLNSNSGSIRATFAKEPSASIEAEANSGSVRSNFNSKGGDNYLHADLGDGEYSVRAKASSGSITLNID